MSLCDHCGEECADSSIYCDEKIFCCFGCKAVFQILKNSDLNHYYQLEKQPGQAPESGDFSFLDLPEISERLLDFKMPTRQKVTFNTPSIHCISCVWLLEHLFQIKVGVYKSEVNYGQREVSISFDPKQISLREIAELLQELGYKPRIQLDGLDKKKTESDKTPLIRLTVAGICFGNIMLFSFPAYFGIEDKQYDYFNWFNFLFSLPVFFYSGSGYWNSLKTWLVYRKLTLDLPVFLGMVALFFESCRSLFMDNTHGYWDSLSGLIFFLLLGRYFQDLSFKQFGFDRDYKSFFPVWSLKKEKGEYQPIPVDHIKKGDTLNIRNGELVPCDSRLLDEKALFDYSFVSGESDLIAVKKNDRVFAGGRLSGSSVCILVEKEVNRGALTSLWNEISKGKTTVPKKNLAESVAQFFTPSVIIIALGASIYQYFHQPELTLQVFVSILIVACPCALALSAPLCFGFSARHLAKWGIYFRDSKKIENLASIDTIIFDKTGTLTETEKSHVSFKGVPLKAEEAAGVFNLCRHSTHPLSQKISSTVKKVTPETIKHYEEFSGLGISGQVNNCHYRLGSAKWLKAPCLEEQSSYLEIDGKLRGAYLFNSRLREGMAECLKSLNRKFDCQLLSGDHSRDRSILEGHFKQSSKMHFSQTPKEKLTFVEQLNQKNKNVLMIGDGLNDAGALKSSDLGFAVVEKENAFFPACDALIQSHALQRLPHLLAFSRSVVTLVRFSFTISILYNLVGLGFAITGNITPLLSAILMPISSLSIFLISGVGVFVIHRKHSFK